MKKINLMFPIFASLISFVVAHTGEDDSAHHMTGGMMGNWMMGGSGTGWWIFGWLFSILVLVALVLLIVWLVKQIQKK